MVVGSEDTRELSIIINSFLDAKGFKKAEEHLNSIRAGAAKISSFFEKVRLNKNTLRDIEKLKKASIELRGTKYFDTKKNKNGKEISENKAVALYDKRLKKINEINLKEEKNNKILNENIKKQKIKQKSIEKSIKKEEEGVKRTNKLIAESNIKKPSIFNFKRGMGALSILFATQAISQAIKTMTNSVISSFMKITEGEGAAARGITTLSANFEYLRFTMGAIVNLITKISEFIQLHPKLITFGLGFAFIGTKIAWAFSQVILLGAGIMALTGEKSIVTGIGMIGDKFKDIGTKIKTLVNTDLPNLSTKLVGLIVAHPILTAIIVALGLLTINMLKFPEATDKVKKSSKHLWDSFKENIIDITNSFLSFFTDWKLGNKDFANVFASGISLVLNNLALTLDIIASTIITIIEGFKTMFGYNLVKGFKNLVDGDKKTKFFDGYVDSAKKVGTAWKKTGKEFMYVGNEFYKDTQSYAYPNRQVSQSEFAMMNGGISNGYVTQTGQQTIEQLNKLNDAKIIDLEITKKSTDAVDFANEINEQANIIKEQLASNTDLNIDSIFDEVDAIKVETEARFESNNELERANILKEKQNMLTNHGSKGGTISSGLYDALAEGARREGQSVSDYTGGAYI